MAFEWPEEARPVEAKPDSFAWPEDVKVPVAAHSRKPRARIGAAIGGAIGGTAGKFIPVPGGNVAAAGAGGAAGEALQQGLEANIPTMNPIGSAIAGLALGGADVSEIAKQGGAQAAYEAVGGPVAKVIGKVGGFAGRQLMSKALSPAKGLVKNFPTVVEDALRQGATVNRWFGKGGQQAAERAMKSATGSVVGLLRAATRRGESIDIQEVARPVIDAVEKKAGQLSAVEREQLIASVEKRADELLLQSVMGATRRSSKLMSPMMADELRKAGQRSARTVLSQESMQGVPQTAIPDLDRLITKGASDAVKGLRGVGAARAIEQKAIGVQRAVREAELRPAGASVGLGVGPIKAGIGLPPGAASRMALLSGGLANPLLGPILANLLRTGGLGIQAASE